MILVDTSVLIDFFRGSNRDAGLRFKLVLEQGLDFGITDHVFQDVLRRAKSGKEYSLLRRYLETQILSFRQRTSPPGRINLRNLRPIVPNDGSNR